MVPKFISGEGCHTTDARANPPFHRWGEEPAATGGVLQPDYASAPPSGLSRNARTLWLPQALQVSRCAKAAIGASGCSPCARNIRASRMPV
jgi:hypothetical protein